MDKELGRVEVMVLEGGFVGGNGMRYNNSSNGGSNSSHNINQSALQGKSIQDQLPLSNSPYITTLFRYLCHNSARFWPY